MPSKTLDQIGAEVTAIQEKLATLTPGNDAWNTQLADNVYILVQQVAALASAVQDLLYWDGTH